MIEKTDISKEREAAEKWLRDRYGAYRGHFAWRELEEAFLAGRASLSANAGEPTKAQIREVFMAHGFSVKEGQADLKQYVYDAAYALLTLAAPPTAQAEGWIGVDERLPEHGQAVAFVVRTDGFQQHLNGRVLGGCFVRGQGFSVPGLGLEATHWMPLPPPPTSAEGVEHG